MIAMTIRALADARSSSGPSSSKAGGAGSKAGGAAAGGGTFFFSLPVRNDPLLLFFSLFLFLSLSLSAAGNLTLVPF